MSTGPAAGPVEYTEEYKTIARSLTRGELGLLIGAGMSADCGIPDGSDLAIAMLRRAVLGDEKGDTTPHFGSVSIVL